MFDDIITVFGIPFMQNALMTGILVGIMCAFVGVYIVMRRIVFVGAALAQISSTGFAVGILLGWNPVMAALGLTIIGVLVFAYNLQSKRIPQDSTLALGYTIASAGSILLLSKHPKGDADLMSLLFGNILTITPDQIWILLGTLVVLGIIHVVFYKEFLFTAFDPEMAETLGFRPQFWNIAFYLTVGILISLAIKSAGILLVFGFLVIPAITAILITQNMKRLFILSMFFAVISVPIGLYLSFTKDLPSGPTIVAVLTGFLIIGTIAGKFRKG